MSFWSNNIVEIQAFIHFSFIVILGHDPVKDHGITMSVVANRMQEIWDASEIHELVALSVQVFSNGAMATATGVLIFRRVGAVWYQPGVEVR